MRPKAAALAAFVGTLLLSILLLAGFVRDVASFSRDLIPLSRILASAIYLFASATLTLFLYSFHRSSQEK